MSRKGKPIELERSLGVARGERDKGMGGDLMDEGFLLEIL